jgi:hypothetical protein
MRVNGADICRKCANVRVVLLRVFCQHRLAQFTFAPRNIKRMFEHGILHYRVKQVAGERGAGQMFICICHSFLRVTKVVWASGIITTRSLHDQTNFHAACPSSDLRFNGRAMREPLRP